MITLWNGNQFKSYLAEMYLTKFATKLYATNVRFIRWASLLQVSKWDSIFFQFNNGTIETSRFRQLLWLQYELLLPSLASYYWHDRSLLMSRRNIIFTFFLFDGHLTWVRRHSVNVRRIAWQQTTLSCKHGFHFQRSWSNFGRHFEHLL